MFPLSNFHEFFYIVYCVPYSSKRNSFTHLQPLVIIPPNSKKARVQNIMKSPSIVGKIGIKKKKKNNKLPSFQGSKSRVQDNRKSRLGRVIKGANFHAGTISKRAGKNPLLGLSSFLLLSLSHSAPRFQATESRSIGSAKETGEIDESLKSNSSGIRLEKVERIPRVTTVRDSEHI